VTEKDGTWLKYARGPLAGAGSWTHQYAEPGNTTCSDDQLVKCPLGLLWFGEPGPGTMADRHIRATAPLATGGRFFVQGEGYASTRGAGENVIAAYDAYNGRKLWERAVPSGTLRTGMSSRASNLAANADSLFAIVGDKCLRLDAATGETKFTYQMPAAPDGKQRNWEYLACVGDLLYGARAARPPATDGLFALDVADGRPRWSYAAGDVPCSAIAIGDGMLFFADKQTAPVYRVVALDAVTGKKLWEKPVDLTGCCSGHTWGTLGAMYRNNVLLLFGVYSDGHYWQEFFQDQFGQRRVVALSAKDGNALWSKLIGYRVRPLVVGDTFHAEPWAFDLATGRQKTRIHPVTGREEVWQFARPGHHCGCPAASPHTLLFRSNYLGWYDLAGDTGTRHFGAQRPGCWINFIPANGLLIVPEASSGCLCAFPNMCTVVFKHREEERQWAWYSSPGPMTPVKRLALNFGSPGDRKDRDGALWFGYPRPGGPLVLQFKVDTSLFPGGGYFNHDPARLEIEGTDKPWVFHSGIRGLRQCELPLQEAGAKPSRYTVRLAFAELDQEAAGARVFDIKLQDKVVAKDFDVLRQAGGRRKAILSEFPGVEAGEKLKLELAPKTGKPTAEQLPVLQGIEVVRED
jgi:outer membrane protein assembly factor BamB